MKRFVAVSLAALVVAAGAFAWAVTHPAASGPVESWRLKPGESVRSVSQRLVAEGRIPSWGGAPFRIVSRVRGLDKRLRPGFYNVHRTLSVWDAVGFLLGPSHPGLRATLPEGRTCQDLSGILFHAQVVKDSAEFARMCKDTSVARQAGIPGTTGLEGYLFPDTYLFDGTETPLDVVKIMFRHQQQVLKEVGDSSSSIVKTYGWHGAVTLASIVEREAAVHSEAPLIAGVFIQRLHQDWTLGADPTVRYAIGKFTGPLKVSELNVESPYNTRKYPGLPPGPIANPGREALRAVFHPDTAERFMYFVAKDDGSREHFFSRDMSAHNRLKNQAAHNRAKSGLKGP